MDDTSVDSHAFDYDDDRNEDETYTGFGDERNLGRVTMNKSTELNHAKCVEALDYVKFEWNIEEID